MEFKISLVRTKSNSIFHWGIVSPLFIIWLFFLVSCGGDGTSISEEKNCRLREMYYLLPERYSFLFKYHEDGMLKEVNSPDLNLQYHYLNGKLVEITSGNQVKFSYDYPSETHMRWSSSDIDAECNLYHHGDKIDSLVVNYPANLAIGQLQMKFMSVVEYSTNDIARITNYASNTPEKTGIIKDIVYDNGFNPIFLLYQSTGVFTGQDLFDYFILSLKPEGCSMANPIRYASGWIDPADPAIFQDAVSIFHTYVYPPQSSYPNEIERWAGQKAYFEYEYCD